MSFLSSVFSSQSSGPRLETISAPSAVKFHGDADTVFVEVRGLGEVAASGTIKGALVAPLPEFANHARPDGSGKLPAADAGKRIVLVCASGARSGAAGQQLIRMGYDNVANLSGGIGAWARAGGPMQR
jgi:rhodanese-related sulfurtransferase